MKNTARVGWILGLAALLAAMPAAAGPPGEQESVRSEVGPETAPGTANQLGGPMLEVGERIELSFESPEITVAAGEEEQLVWVEEIGDPGASYIAAHFSYFKLPPEARLVIVAPDGSRSWEYRGTGKADLGVTEGFWGIHINGDRAILELYSAVPVPAGAVQVDSYARGFDADLPPLETKSPLETKAICGIDDSEWARCYEDCHPEIYFTSRPVARLLINGTGACTGWLVGSEGHLMTNNHCIGSLTDALNTDYELMAEGANCDTNCAGWLWCAGTVVATWANLIQTHTGLDYTLVHLPVNPTGRYGFLQMRDRGTYIGERIDIPGHPQAWGKRISLFSTHPEDSTGYCQVMSITRPACMPGSPVDDVGYYCDTQAGSSGSPVLGLCDNAVIALHHCANCPNRGVPIEAIIDDLELGANVPPNGISTNSWTCDDCGPGWCDEHGSFCDKYGCYSPTSTISRAFCLCGLLDPRCGAGSCVGPYYCTGANCPAGLCYIDTAPQSQVMCQDMDLDADCNVY